MRESRTRESSRGKGDGLPPRHHGADAFSAQPVQLRLQDVPAGQPVGEPGRSQVSPGPTTPSPQLTEQPVLVLLEVPPAEQLGEARGGLVAPAANMRSLHQVVQLAVLPLMKVREMGMS